MLEFRILGPVEVLRDGAPIPIGGVKLRALLADLVLHANEVVPADRLIDDLWGEEPPDTASHMLHVYVSRLRKLLQDEGPNVLQTRPTGYVLRVEPPDGLDASTVEQDVRRGVGTLEARPREALELFDRSLNAWRGPALEEFAGESFAQPSVARLEDLRQTTLEHRLEALLALGRNEEALLELEPLIARFPLRERARELQMLALYRAGRQADALAAFQAARRALADELGIDPGPGLRSLEEAILRQDESLRAPPRIDGEAGSRPAVGPILERAKGPVPQGLRARRPSFLYGVAAALVIAVVLVWIFTAGGGTPPRASRLPLDWNEVPSADAFDGSGNQVVLGGRSTPFGYFAVGYTASVAAAGQPPDFDTAVWMAPEGAPGAWERVSRADFLGPGNQRASAIALFHDQIVIVGRDSSTGDFDAAVWISGDRGATWDRVGKGSLALRQRESDDAIRDVAVAGGDLIAVGDSRTPQGDLNAAVWRSSGGARWASIAVGGLGGLRNQDMLAVTTLGDLVVAAGWASTPDGDRDAAVWYAHEGSDEWTPVIDAEDSAVLGGDEDEQINAITAAGPGLIAVGQETIGEDTDAVVWTSTDGKRWERVSDPRAGFGGPGAQSMFTVAASHLGIVAAGTEGTGPRSDGVVWTSSDGLTWRREATSTDTAAFTGRGGQSIRVLIPTTTGFVALGSEAGSTNNADAWIGTPAANGSSG